MITIGVPRLGPGPAAAAGSGNPSGLCTRAAPSSSAVPAAARSPSTSASSSSTSSSSPVPAGRVGRRGDHRLGAEQPRRPGRPARWPRRRARRPGPPRTGAPRPRRPRRGRCACRPAAARSAARWPRWPGRTPRRPAPARARAGRPARPASRRARRRARPAARRPAAVTANSAIIGRVSPADPDSTIGLVAASRTAPSGSARQPGRGQLHPVDRVAGRPAARPGSGRSGPARPARRRSAPAGPRPPRPPPPARHPRRTPRPAGAARPARAGAAAVARPARPRRCRAALAAIRSRVVGPALDGQRRRPEPGALHRDRAGPGADVPDQLARPRPEPGQRQRPDLGLGHHPGPVREGVVGQRPAAGRRHRLAAGVPAPVRHRVRVAQAEHHGERVPVPAGRLGRGHAWSAAPPARPGPRPRPACAASRAAPAPISAGPAPGRGEHGDRRPGPADVHRGPAAPGRAR